MSALVPARMVRLVVARHGEAGGNRDMRYLGSTDAPLTEFGLAQAEQLGQALASFGLDAIYTSPLVRALATAEAIARATGLTPLIEPALRESAYGAWEGLTHAEVRERDPALLRAWETDPDIAPPGGGESLRATRDRVVAWVRMLAVRHPGQTIALVSHVGPVKSLVCHALELGPDGMRRLWLDPASITVVDWPVAPEGRAALRLYNAFGHLAHGVRWLPQ